MGYVTQFGRIRPIPKTPLNSPSHNPVKMGLPAGLFSHTVNTKKGMTASRPFFSQKRSFMRIL